MNDLVHLDFVAVELRASNKTVPRTCVDRPMELALVCQLGTEDLHRFKKRFGSSYD